MSTARSGGGQCFSQANFSSKNTTQQKVLNHKPWVGCGFTNQTRAVMLPSFLLLSSRYDSASEIPSQKLGKKTKKIAQSAQAGAGDTLLIINLSWNAKNALRLNSLPGRVYIRLNEFVQRKGGRGCPSGEFERYRK